MNVQLTSRMGDIMKYAREEAARTGCPCVEPDHIMLGIIRHADNPVCDYLKSLDLSVEDLKQAVESTFKRGANIDFSDFESIIPSRATLSLMSASMMEAARFGLNVIDVQHAFLALMRREDNCTAVYMNACGVDFQSVESDWKSRGLLKQGAEPPLTSGRSKVFNIVMPSSKIFS